MTEQKKFHYFTILKGFLHRKQTFDILYSIKKYAKMYYTLWCKNVPNKRY